MVHRETGQLPVAGRAVLAGGAFDQPSVRRAGIGAGPDAGHVREEAQPHGLQMGHAEAGGRAGAVAEGIRSFVAEPLRVGGLPHSQRVAHDHQDATLTA